MAKTSSIQKDLKKRRLVEKYKTARASLKEKIYDKNISMEERMSLQMQLSELPRSSSRTRVRNRCALTGRARGYHRDFGLSRIALREKASQGLCPGVRKASWG